MAIGRRRATLVVMLRRCGFACICALFAFAIPAHAASLDPSFGDGGRVLVNFGGMGGAIARDVAAGPAASERQA
jgi:hypothetical protein